MATERSDWYDIGDVVTLDARFRNYLSGNLVDPDTLTCTVTNPDGDVSTPTPVRASTGVYSATVAPTVPGVWKVRWVGTGDAAAAEPDHFLVRDPAG